MNAKRLVFGVTAAFLWAGCGSCDRQARPAGKLHRSIPTAAISVDGDAQDWTSVPVRLRVEPRMLSSYKPTAVRIAADDDYLYVLFELGLGVRERFDKQVPSGHVESAALGYLNLMVDGVKYRCWVPTGVSMSLKYGKPSFGLTMSYEVARAKASKETYETILEKEYPSDEGFFGLGGKHVEIKIPLKSLGAKSDSEWEIAFDAF